MRNGCRNYDGGERIIGIIRLENVIKIVPGGQRAVNYVSFTIQGKENVVIYGTPGSGKSILMRLIAGMEAPSAGKIFVMDKALHEMSSDAAAGFRNRTFGIMQRDPCLIERLTVLENVTLPLAVRGISYGKRIQAAKEQLKTLGLLNVAHTYPTQISFYEAQMVSLARALIAKPQILLLDEMTAGLSITETHQILGIIHALWKFGKYTIVSFSGTKSCMFHADRYFMMDHGMIWEEIQENIEDRSLKNYRLNSL